MDEEIIVTLSVTGLVTIPKKIRVARGLNRKQTYPMKIWIAEDGTLCLQPITTQTMDYGNPTVDIGIEPSAIIQEEIANI